MFVKENIVSDSLLVSRLFESKNKILSVAHYVCQLLSIIRKNIIARSKKVNILN